MLRNYFKTAIRSLSKNKLYSSINILGLALGMAICILVFLFIRHETSYDQSYDDSENIYRVTGAFTGMQETGWLAVTPYPIASMVREELPEVVASTILNSAWKEMLFKANGQTFYSKQYASVDTSFFDVFSLKFLAGNKKTALSDPANIILSKKMATRLFGEEDPMGQLIQYNNNKEYKVAGVIQNPEHPTHFKYDIYFPWHKKDIRDNEWVSMFNYYTYVKLKPGTDPIFFDEKMNQLLQGKLAGLLQNANQADLSEEETNQYLQISMQLQPLTDIHLHSTNLEGNIGAKGSPKQLYIYGLVAMIMLLIAAINFMNMSTARSANRAKEVGVRKVIGATRWNASMQFLVESMLQSFIAMLLAFLLAEFLLPYFNVMMELELKIFQAGVGQIIFLAILFALFTGLLAGSYPAFFLSGFQPIKVLKGDFSKSKESAPLRKGLVVFQFMICSALIFFLLIVVNQINFLANKELGFHAEQVVSIPIQTNKLANNFSTLKNNLLNIPGVKAVTVAEDLPGDQMGGNGYAINGKQKILDFDLVDEDFLKVLDIELVQGRFFTKKDISDTIPTYVVNEAFVKFFELQGDPVGQLLRGGNGDGQIIGVVADFHWQGLSESIQPFVFQELDSWLPKAAIRVESNDLSQTVQKIKNEWATFEPNHPMRYSFLDEDFGALFKSYENFGKSLSYITLLIVFTAILGLFGLATYMAEQRTKEIGIRKVLGASIPQIMFLMVKDFVRLVVIAGIIALPLGYWISRQWLEEFAYQLPLGVGPFFGSLALILIVSVLTVSIQAYRASSANPIQAIKAE